jgi:hypothetical protein
MSVTPASESGTPDAAGERLRLVALSAALKPGTVSELLTAKPYAIPRGLQSAVAKGEVAAARSPAVVALWIL